MGSNDSNIWSDGEYNLRSIKGIGSLNDNVVRTLTLSDADRVREQISTALNLEWKIFENFTYTLNAGTQLTNTNNSVYDVEVGDDFLPHTSFGNNKFQTYQVSNIFTWNKDMGRHGLKLTGVQEYSNQKGYLTDGLPRI